MTIVNKMWENRGVRFKREGREPMETIIKHLLLGVVVFIVYYKFQIHAEKKTYQLKFESEDGYVMTFKQLIRVSHEAKRFAENATLTRVDAVFLSVMFLPYMLGYTIFFAIGFGVEKLWGIPAIWMNHAYAPIILTFLIYESIKGKKPNLEELNGIAKTIRFTSPEKFSHLGKYISNQNEFDNLTSRLKKKETEVKKAKEYLELLEMESENVSVKLIDEKRRKNTEDKLKTKIRLKKKNEEILLTLKQIEHVLTDEIPELYADILNQKKEKTVITNGKFVPHHIHVLMEISKDTDLPEEMRRDAEESLQLYVSKQLEEAKEKALEDVQLDLTIAKKMMKEE